MIFFKRKKTVNLNWWSLTFGCLKWQLRLVHAGKNRQTGAPAGADQGGMADVFWLDLYPGTVCVAMGTGTTKDRDYLVDNMICTLLY